MSTDPLRYDDVPAEGDASGIDVEFDDGEGKGVLRGDTDMESPETEDARGDADGKQTR